MKRLNAELVRLRGVPPPAFLHHSAIAAFVLLASNIPGCAGSPSAATGTMDDSSPARVAPVCSQPAGTGEFPEEPNALHLQVTAKGYMLVYQSTGEPNGVFVSMAQNPILTRAEALQIISDGAAQYGLAFTEQGVPLESVAVDRYLSGHEYDWISGRQNRAIHIQQVPLVLDFKDPVHRVGIVYAEPCAVLDLQFKAGCLEPARTAREVAERFCKRMAEEGHGVYFGAFYYPADYQLEVRKLMGERVSEAKEQCVLRLQEQLMAFAEWLRAEGVVGKERPCQD